MILEQQAQDPVVEDDVGEVFNQEVPETEIIGYDIDVPV